MGLMRKVSCVVVDFAYVGARLIRLKSSPVDV